MKKKDKLDIIYEDKDLLVLNKPAGLLTIATDKEKENTLFHKALVYAKKKNKNNKIFIVHRLDKDTSGLVVLAKNMKIKSLLQKNWETTAKKREYVAVVEGIPDKKQDTLKSWLFEDKTHRVYSSNNKKGLLAITNYRVVCNNSKYSLLSIEINTGRKNQIRVQLSDIACPIIGDKKYNAKTNPIRRMGLHANKLVIVHPITNKEMVFETDVPNSFINMFK